MLKLKIRSALLQLKNKVNKFSDEAVKDDIFLNFNELESSLDKLHTINSYPENYHNKFELKDFYESMVNTINQLDDKNINFETNTSKLTDYMIINSSLISAFESIITELKSLVTTDKINVIAEIKTVDKRENTLTIALSCRKDIFAKHNDDKVYRPAFLEGFQLVEQMGAKLEITSSSRLGTKITIESPYQVYIPYSPAITPLKTEVLIISKNHDYANVLINKISNENNVIHFSTSVKSVVTLVEKKLVNFKRLSLVVYNVNDAQLLDDTEQKIVSFLGEHCNNMLVLYSGDVPVNFGYFKDKFNQVTIHKEDDLDLFNTTKTEDIPEKETSAPIIDSAEDDAQEIEEVEEKEEKDNLVLLVDDSDMTRQIMREVLERHNIFVHEAVGGREALELIKKTKYNLVLVDIMMPEMNGIELTKIIKSIPAYEHIPIIGITGDANVKKENEFLFAGGYEFWVKSINPDILYEKINNILIKSRLFDKSISDLYCQKDDVRRAKLLNLYVKEVRSCTQLFSTSKDLEQIRESAHKLVSSSLYCGYMLTRDKAMQLEESIINKEQNRIIMDIKNDLITILRLTEEHVLEML